LDGCGCGVSSLLKCFEDRRKKWKVRKFHGKEKVKSVADNKDLLVNSYGKWMEFGN